VHSLNLKQFRKNIRDIFAISIPISASQIINSLSFSCKALLIPKCLQISGLTSSDAMAIFGKTSGMVMPLLFFPAIFISSLSSNIIPKMSLVLSQNNPNKAFNLAQKCIILTNCFSLCLSSFLIILSKPIADLFFYGNYVENIICCFAIGIPYFYIENLLLAILRGTGNNKTPLLNSFYSFFIENALIILLVSKPNFGIYGYAIALITASFVSTFISLDALEKYFCNRFNTWNIIIKPLICCLFMCFILNKTYPSLAAIGFPTILSIGTAFILGASGYIALAGALGLFIIIRQ
jgi:stage V sporulation protein B